MADELGTIAIKIIVLRVKLNLPELRERPDSWLRQAHERGVLLRWLRALECAAQRQAHWVGTTREQL